MRVEGKGGISATIIADSISSSGKRITTFELIYPRFIHAEFMTHRLFSRNAASSRAIPVKKIIEQIEDNPAKPIHWGKNQPGMQAKEELNGLSLLTTQAWWGAAANNSCTVATELSAEGAHKQIVNRVLEPFQFIKVVCTATEFKNFFWLRCHEDAQPEIKELADCMEEAMWQSHPELLKAGEWHTPYVGHYRDAYGELLYTLDTDNELLVESITLEQALKVSSSCCAQISYRVLDESLDKAEKIYQQLVESEPVHASPFEHQASPMAAPNIEGFEKCSHGITKIPRLQGTTHYDIDGNAWSGNFQGWIQHRQLIKGHTKW